MANGAKGYSHLGMSGHETSGPMVAYTHIQGMGIGGRASSFQLKR